MSRTTDIAWSPNGSQLALVRGTKTWDGSGDISPRYLWMLDLRSGNQRRLEEVADSESISSFGVSIAWLTGRTPKLVSDKLRGPTPGGHHQNNPVLHRSERGLDPSDISARKMQPR